jgi:3-phosphoshikimate 1-carboxyvinyltransferase
MPRLPDPIAILPRGPLDARVRVPGSKSITNRALLVAALAEGPSQLRGALASDDTEAMARSLRRLGVGVETSGTTWTVRGSGARLRRPDGPLDVGNSGTTARFLTAAACLAEGPVEIDGDARMRERPIGDLIEALRALGARCEALGPGACPPVRVEGGPLAGGRAVIDASRSSQYVSGVLLAAPYAKADVVLELAGGRLISRPYVELTLQVMRAFGASAGWTPEGHLRVASGAGYRGRAFDIEPDASAAAYPFCAAAIAGGRVRVDGLPQDSIQADLGLLPILASMGCRIRRGPDFAEVTGPEGSLRPVDVDLNDLPDAALALAVVALFADGTSRIRNVGSLRIKETDRLAALEAELTRLGARATAGPEDLTIEPGALHGAVIRTYRDHRMAMAFALAGLRVPGVLIQDPSCVAKTWPDYFSMLDGLS